MHILYVHTLSVYPFPQVMLMKQSGIGLYLSVEILLGNRHVAFMLLLAVT